MISFASRVSGDRTWLVAVAALVTFAAATRTPVMVPVELEGGPARAAREPQFPPGGAAAGRGP
ncbi:hypothetical protein ACFY2R_15240 [Micromonospora olivasterospora]|uniref:hypothetical protein n=1 Tax=Micromonospora olivasterospora TaxID=1880 RepID=UPI0011A22560|nr:hypothetical protein [Micromonospora olivasterospora]